MQKERPELRKEFLSVIVPAYNESGRIGPNLKSIAQYLTQRFEQYEILVVDDGSADGTAGLVRRFSEGIASLKLLSYTANRGKGFAVRKGVTASKGSLILMSDADMSTPIEELEKLLEWYDRGADIIIGSRSVAGSEILVRQPWWREYMGKTFNCLIRAVLMGDYHDTQCGFKLMRGEAARDIFRNAVIDGFAFDVELLFEARRRGLDIKEVPVRWLNSPESRVRPVAASLSMLRDLLRIRLRSGRVGAWR
jgi:dolichyl-phosphate beta-glucosyltransferase